jgi:hypothetical protein
MKKVCLPAAFVVLLGLAAFAQSPTPSDPQSGSQGTVPSTSPSTSPSQTPDMNSGSQSQTGMQNGQSTQGRQSNTSKGEKKIKGCVQSQGGSYVLMDKHGKQIPISGSDLAAHVGHTVTVHGTYGYGGGSSAMSTSSGSDSGQTFNVTKVDVNSDTCKMEKSEKGNRNNGNSGTSSQSPQ